ncbi:MAG: type II CRISPR RNA-guided endonuclease Cas9 [Sideroxydans sp.]|nr:type II CRISPR RNA-guided endonuclease Cas9 [Sideroxydans sp.]
MTGKQKNYGPLTFGLDIGIASVGWAVLGGNRIIDLGVRCFDKAETAKEGESLNLARRTARLMRRRLRRRAWRLTKLARLLKREGLIPDVNILKQQPAKGFKTPNLWKLRVEALDRKLEAEEWARVIYHLCKHRGFHWISRAEEKAAEGDSKSEGGKVKQGLAGTKKLMQEKNYRTAAEMVLAEFPEAQRNKQGDYSKALSRVLLSNELALLFKRQRELGNPHASDKLQAEILGNGDKKSGLFWAQNPALSGKYLLKMLGRCTFEKEEYRAPKASFTAERHVWLTRLNNLRIVVDGITRPLNEQERRVALPLPYQQVGDFTYKQLRSALVKAGYLPDSFLFTGLAYPSERQKKEEKTKDPESEKLIKLPAWQTLHKTLKDKELETEWQQISVAAIDSKPELLDKVAEVLSVYKDDEEVETELRKLALPNAEKIIDALLDIRFDKFSNLSLKALYRIVPLMEQGQRYDEAVAAIPEYGHHSQLHKVGAGEHKYLPPFYSGRDKDGRMVFNDDMDIPRNPVVLRALNQARKVVNALISKYKQQPHSVHIEMARDLSRPLDERNKVKKAQEEYRDRNATDKALFVQEFSIVGTPKGREFEKWQLYREQQGKCAYSIEPIDLNRLFESGYVEIDHALPYSRSFDDSKNNRVLVLARENRNKGNRTPYEYLSGADNSERWQKFVGFVNTTKAYRLAKRNRLLRKDFGEKEAKDFRERNLNDTRYICKFFKNYVEQYLQLHGDSEAKRCVVLSGQMTSFLRARWGLMKVREESDRHHALDAAVVAACSHGMVKRLSDYSRRKELDQVSEGFVDVETGEIVNPAMFQRLQEHFPDPWPRFRDEVQARLKIDDGALLREEMQRLGTYPPEHLESLRPLFVSRAPQRRNSGAAHKDTIYGQPERLKAQGGVTQKVALSSLKLSDLDKLIDPHRNEKLYAAIRARLEQHDGKGDKAFPTDNPLRKPDRDGNPIGPIVRTVTMVIDKLSGIPIRGGVAKNDSMLRVDVFTKTGKFYLVPIYVNDAVANKLPDRAATANTPRTEWTLIDDNFDFHFSLYPNDLIKLKNKESEYFGYFAGVGVTTASLSIRSHDNNQAIATGKSWQGTWVNLGVKTNIQRFEKFNVDVLGNIYPAPPEQRRDLA